MVILFCPQVILIWPVWRNLYCTFSITIAAHQWDWSQAVKFANTSMTTIPIFTPNQIKLFLHQFKPTQPIGIAINAIETQSAIFIVTSTLSGPPTIFPIHPISHHICQDLSTSCVHQFLSGLSFFTTALVPYLLHTCVFFSTALVPCLILDLTGCVHTFCFPDACCWRTWYT